MHVINKKYNIELSEWISILEQTGLIDKLCSANIIAIKPNLAAGHKADPQKHVCTDMNLLSNIIDLCHELNNKATMLICESDSTGHGFAYLKFEHFGLPDSLNISENAKRKTKVLDLSRDRLIQKENEGLLYFYNNHQLWLSEKFCEADFVISLANLKMHSVTLFTGACKNLFGCLPDFEKSGYHPYIHEVVHDLTVAINPDLSVVDAFYAMEKNGPVAGIDVSGNFRIFSNNAVEADVLGATTVGIKPNQVKYLSLLSKDMTIPSLDDNEISTLRFIAKLPDKTLRINNRLGLALQKHGLNVANTGDILHVARTPFRAFIAIVRPLLIKVFGLKRLKTIKGRIEGERNND